MEQGKHKQYTAEDIVRYHQGLLTPQEMHQMERAALEDPFLADAMDGYTHAQQPREDVAALRQELARRTGRKGVVVPLRARTFLRIAALFVLLAGFGWIAYQYDTGNKDLAVQQEKAAPAAKETAVPPAATADSIGHTYEPAVPQDQTAVARPGVHRERKTAAPEEPATAAAAPSIEAAAETIDREEVATRNVKSATAPAAAGAAEQAQNRGVPASANYISGKVVDNNNMAVPHAQVNVLQQKTSVRADANGAFSIPAQDSTVTVTVQSEGYQEQQASLKNNAANRVVLQPSEAAVNEVVISKNSSKRKQPATRVTLDGAAPVRDARNYERFILEQLEPFESNVATIGGTVELAFDIDAAGKPVNIEIEKSSCTRCDSAAMKALQFGPRLKKTGKKQKARARIVF